MPSPIRIASSTGRTSAAVTLRFMAGCGTAFGIAFLLASMLYRLAPPAAAGTEIAFPSVFWLTTLFLAVGSLAMHSALGAVRRERQRTFRKALLLAMTSGVLFVAVQSYGIVWMIRNQRPSDVQTGVNAFATCLTALHALHFTLAMMILMWVTVQAFADRYDHEYHWGVTVCSWFWHALGVIWTAILVIFAIALV